MAIVFTQDLSEQNILYSFNNNVIKYSVTGFTVDVAYSEIQIGTSPVIRIYPNPDGYFYFNFKDYINSLIYSKNFIDDLDIDMATNEFYDWTSRILLTDSINIKAVNKKDNDQSITINPTFLSAYNQLTDYRKLVNFNKDNFYILSPFFDIADKKTTLKFWRGYPFDFSIYKGLVDEIDINGNVYELDNLVSRFAITDGATNGSLDSILNIGHNELQILDNSIHNLIHTLELELIDFKCGNYFKWINRYGGWNYYLFSDSNIDRSTKELGEINNDFDNLENTTSKTLQMGKTSFDKITVDTETLTKEESLIIEDLIDSPKIYYFVGEPNAVNNFDDWVEVSLATSNARLKTAKQDLSNLKLTFELPQRDTRTL